MTSRDDTTRTPGNYQTIEVGYDGRVAWIALNRPTRLNVINSLMVTELGEALDRVERDDIQVVVLTGTGTAFCAGADLADARGTDGELTALLPFVERTQDLLIRIRELPMPVIAAVNGVAMGGGLELALAADIVYAAEGAKIADAHANIGIIPGAGGSTVLPRRIGLGLASYLLYTGATLRSEDLCRAGLIVAVHPRDELARQVATVANRIAEKSALSLRVVKELIRKGAAAESETDALRLELKALRTHVASHDMAEGIQAFLDGRSPQFTGR